MTLLSEDQKKIICEALQMYTTKCNETLNNSLAVSVNPTIQLDLSRDITIALNLIELVEQSNNVTLSAAFIDLVNPKSHIDPFDNAYDAENNAS